ncbi:unnamed protein product, partial [Coccothraustes coccothraustes]
GAGGGRTRAARAGPSRGRLSTTAREGSGHGCPAASRVLSAGFAVCTYDAASGTRGRHGCCSQPGGA